MERCNRTLKDKISARLMSAPELSWGFQVLDTMNALNNQACNALGGKMTRSQALFGHANLQVRRPNPSVVAELLGFDRCAPGLLAFSICVKGVVAQWVSWAAVTPPAPPPAAPCTFICGAFLQSPPPTPPPPPRPVHAQLQ